MWEEKIPTTFPIKLQVRISNIVNPQCLATVNFVTSDSEYFYDRIYEKRYYQNYNITSGVSLEYFRDQPDAVITFTSRKVFDYNINGSEITSNKYDFVTVAIQAIGKALGFICNAAASNQSLEMVQPVNKFTSALLSNDVSYNYQLATSGNAYIGKNEVTSTKWYLYSPSTFDSRFSLNYYREDISNMETLFMQPGVAKGSVIRYIGKGIDDFFSYCAWDRPVATSMNSESVIGASTKDVIAYQGQLAQSRALMPTYVAEVYTDNDDNVNAYMWDRLEMGETSNYVLMSDGSWRMYNNLSELAENEDYARTSDGYLRLKIVTKTSGASGRYHNKTATYRLYKYPPQKPMAAMNGFTKSDYSFSRQSRRQYIQSMQSDDDFVDVEIGFKNVEGCKRIIVEQTDSDYPVPYTYYVDVESGCFIAYMNKKYSSTFKLTYYNDEGNTIGDAFTIDLTKEDVATAENMYLFYKDNTLYYKFVRDELPVELFGDYRIVCITNPIVCVRGRLSGSEGCIDTSSLPTGAYVFTAISADGTYSAKWVK